MKRPDLAGTRVQTPGQPQVYFIDDGTRRWLPDAATYNNLFRDWGSIVQSLDTNEIDEGPAITAGAVLARGIHMPEVFLVSNGQKRWIVSGPAMDKFDFSWNAVKDVPPVLLDSIPSGPDIS